MIDKEKAIKIVKLLINNENSELDTKYLKSHEKIAIIYKNQTIEILGGDLKSIKYLSNTIPLKKLTFSTV